MLRITPYRSRLLASFAGLASVVVPVSARAEDLLSGGLLGHLTRGDDFTGPRLLDLIVLGLAVFILLRVITGRNRRKEDAATPPGPDQEPTYRPAPDREPDEPQAPPTGKPDMYTMAQATWDALKSPGARTGTAGARSDNAGPPPGASPDEQFLAGAKLAYSRILTAMAQRDFDDLAQFVTPGFLATLRNQLPATPAGTPDILLVEAELEGSSQENGHTVMRVAYKALLREPGAQQNSERLEHWRLTRDDNVPGAHWLLDGIDRA